MGTPEEYLTAFWGVHPNLELRDPTGQCRKWSHLMKKSFPSLTLVRGFVRLDESHFKRDWPHWWLTTPSGEVVDPTAAQFPGVFKYRPMDEENPITGRCPNCGEWSCTGGEFFCSEECGEEFADSCG